MCLYCIHVLVIRKWVAYGVAYIRLCVQRPLNGICLVHMYLFKKDKYKIKFNDYGQKLCKNTKNTCSFKDITKGLNIETVFKRVDFFKQ